MPCLFLWFWHTEWATAINASWLLFFIPLDEGISTFYVRRADMGSDKMGLHLVCGLINQTAVQGACPSSPVVVKNVPDPVPPALENPKTGWYNRNEDNRYDGITERALVRPFPASLSRNGILESAPPNAGRPQVVSVQPAFEAVSLFRTGILGIARVIKAGCEFAATTSGSNYAMAATMMTQNGHGNGSRKGLRSEATRYCGTTSD